MLHTGFLFSCSYGGLLPTCGTQASYCGDFSGCKIRGLGHAGFTSCDKGA